MTIGAVLLMLMVGNDSVVDAALRHYRAQTSAEVGCAQAEDASDITVCGARAADRYRLQFIEYDKGDPRAETLEQQRARLLHSPTPCEQRGPFLVGCGAIGVTATIKFGAGGTSAPRVRGFAP